MLLQIPGVLDAPGSAPAYQRWTGTKDVALDTGHPRLEKDEDAAK